MQKLSGMDATFLYLETETSPMHIAGLSICKPPTADFDPYEAFKSQIAARLHEIPAFRRILKAAPLNIDHPVWVEVDELDMDYHIQHLHLPKPGDAHELRKLVENLHSQLLDRSRPLWRFYVIEGYEDPGLGVKPGSFALYTKCHHACVDGGAGISVMDIISDREPTPRQPLPKSTIRFYKEDPGFFEMLGNAYGRFVQSQFDTLKMVPDLAKALGTGVKKVVQEGAFSVKDLMPAPKTRFNAAVTRDRTYGAQTLDIYEVISIAKATGTTLNDVVLTVCGGALRTYLDDLGELPAKPLVAAVPVSLREEGDSSQTNQVASIMAAIGSHIEDPIERLRAVNSDTNRAKGQIDIVKDIFPTDFSIFGAPIAISAFAQIASQTKAANIVPGYINLAISNVPGPRKPMYFAGSRVTAYFPVSIATHGVALNITVHSYTHRLDFGLIGDRMAVPNIQSIAEGIGTEFAKLKAAVEAELASRGESLQTRPKMKAGPARSEMPKTPLTTSQKPTKAVADAPQKASNTKVAANKAPAPKTTINKAGAKKPAVKKTDTVAKAATKVAAKASTVKAPRKKPAAKATGAKTNSDAAKSAAKRAAS